MAPIFLQTHTLQVLLLRTLRYFLYLELVLSCTKPTTPAYVPTNPTYPTQPMNTPYASTAPLSNPQYSQNYATAPNFSQVPPVKYATSPANTSFVAVILLSPIFLIVLASRQLSSSTSLCF